MTSCVAFCQCWTILHVIITLPVTCFIACCGGVWAQHFVLYIIFYRHRQFQPSWPFEAEREREEKVGGGGEVAIGATFNGRGEHKFRFAATNVPRQCRLVLLVKVGKVKVRRLEVEKVRWRVEQGEKLSRVLLRSYTILNFIISLGRAALGEILMLIWGDYFWAEFWC
jgi:hypothetical protein